MIAAEVKPQLIDQAAAIVAHRWPHVPPEGACLYAAVAVCVVLKFQGVRAIVQAGSMNWRTVRQEDDDGTEATHYGYTYSPDSPLSRLAVAMGQLPEIHCWAAIPATGEIVDPTTGTLRSRAIRSGIRWTTPAPPPFLWARADRVFDLHGAIYTPTLAAIRHALLYVGLLTGEKKRGGEGLTDRFSAAAVASKTPVFHGGPTPF